jgi:hypothetical protein
MALPFGFNPQKIGFIGQPTTQPLAPAGLPLVIQQLYGGAPFTPGADTMEGGFRTSPGFRPGAPMDIRTGPRPPEGFRNPGFRDFMPKIPGVPFGAQTTLSDLVAFNPAASQYALAGFTVGEILAMPEFADFAQFQAQQTGGTATSAGLASLEAQLQQLGAKGGPEDRGPYSQRFGTAEDQGFGFTGGTGTFQNPALGTFGDTFTPAGSTVRPDGTVRPGLGYAFDEFGRVRNIGIMNDLGLNLANLVGPFANAPIGVFGAVNKITDVFKNFREKQKEAEAKAKADEAKALAEKNKKLADEIKKQFEERKKKKQEKEAKDKADRDKAQRTGTGFKTEKERDTATGKFSGPKGDGPGKGGPTGPGGQTSGPPGREGPGR